jgi:hypothetical protein
MFHYANDYNSYNCSLTAILIKVVMIMIMMIISISITTIYGRLFPAQEKGGFLGKIYNVKWFLFPQTLNLSFEMEC